MSSNSYSFSSASFSFSSSSSTNNGRPFTQSYTSETRANNIHGSATRRTYQQTGQPMVEERTYTDPQGRRIEGGGSRQGQGQGLDGRIEDVTDREEGRGEGVRGQVVEKEGEDEGQGRTGSARRDADREYRERMEDEYAKREGGA